MKIVITNINKRTLDLLENVNLNNTHNETIISAIQEWTKSTTALTHHQTL